MNKFNENFYGIRHFGCEWQLLVSAIRWFEYAATYSPFQTQFSNVCFINSLANAHIFGQIITKSRRAKATGVRFSIGFYSQAEHTHTHIFLDNGFDFTETEASFTWRDKRTCNTEIPTHNPPPTPTQNTHKFWQNMKINGVSRTQTDNGLLVLLSSEAVAPSGRMQIHLSQ